MKKILSIILSLTMILSGICLLSSCDIADAAKTVQKADKALTETPYIMTISLDFSSDNSYLSPTLEALNTSVPVTVDGENMSFAMNLDSSNFEMLIVDRVLYYNFNLLGQDVKVKSTVSDEYYTELRSKGGISMPVSVSHFENMSMETRNGKKVITCSGISDEGRNLVDKSLLDTVGEINDEMDLVDLSFVLTIANGKYESMALNVTYNTVLADQSTTVTTSMTATFTYDGVAHLTAPADAADYTEIDIEDLLG